RRAPIMALVLVSLLVLAGSRPAAGQLAAAQPAAAQPAAGEPVVLSGNAPGIGAPAPGAASSRPQATEVRAVWISNAILSRLGGPSGVLRLLGELAVANVNVILPEAVFRGYTLYPGPYQDPRFAGWPED